MNKQAEREQMAAMGAQDNDALGNDAYQRMRMVLSNVQNRKRADE